MRINVFEIMIKLLYENLEFMYLFIQTLDEVEANKERLEENCFANVCRLNNFL